MDGQWDSKNLVETIRQLCEHQEKVVRLLYHPWNRFLNYLTVSYFNLQTTLRATQVADKHYDLGKHLKKLLALLHRFGLKVI